MRAFSCHSEGWCAASTRGELEDSQSLIILACSRRLNRGDGAKICEKKEKNSESLSNRTSVYEISRHLKVLKKEQKTCLVNLARGKVEFASSANWLWQKLNISASSTTGESLFKIQ